MSLSFRDEILEAGVFSISKCDFYATLEVVKTDLGRWVEEAVPAVSSFVFLPDLGDIVGRIGQILR